MFRSFAGPGAPLLFEELCEELCKKLCAARCAVLCALLLAGCSQESPIPAAESVEPPGADAIDKTDPAWKQMLSEPSLMAFEPGKTYFWDISTNLGEMTFRLFHDTAPQHASSTIYLTELGFYDDIVFHRVIPGFMAQGGDPTGTGMGGPGYKYGSEFAPGVSHDRPGLLSMANSGPNTDGSQFFITFKPTPFLDSKHTILGEMIDGAETLAALEARGSSSGKPLEPMMIIKAVIRVE